MSLRNIFSRSVRRAIVACCLLTGPAGLTPAQEPASLAPGLTTHTSVPELRPVTGDNSTPDATEPPALPSEPPAFAPAQRTDAPPPALSPEPSAPGPASVLAAPISNPMAGNNPLGPIPPSSQQTLIAQNASESGGNSAPVPDPAENSSAPPSPAGAELAANSPVSARASGSPPGDPPTPSSNATINLINLMVRRKLITQDDADGLIREAQQEADIARAQAASTQAKADRALAAQQAAPAVAPGPPPPAVSPDDETRVTYVPEPVKKEITDQVTQNVMEQTREEHLADTIAANQVPDWVKRFHVTGDIRVRYENDMFPSGNAIGNFTNFNAINTSSSGFNINTATPQLPQYNVDQDRNRFRLRARIGAGIDLGDNFTAGMRIATGSDDNPVTENQTIGGANGAQGGDFAKYAIWLDRAFIRYEYGDQPEVSDVSLTIGRFDNPFFNTSMMWANDLGFDGAVVKAKYEVTPGVTPFLTFGGFPVFNTDLNFSSDQSAKFDSEDKYLFAVQGGTHWDITKNFGFIGAAGYYDFDNIQGKVSDPIADSAINAGNTDDSRPSFAQNGNTYIALRDYEDPNAVPDVTVQNQYFGLATPFRVLALTGQLEYSGFDPFHMSVTGEVIKNLAFDRNNIVNGGPASDPGPQNNTTSLDPNSFDGGDMGYMVHADFGKVVLEKLWDWNARVSYRYVETDATVDAFTDSDFGATLTGTNLKGYTIEGQLGLGARVWAGLRWMSADNVSGPTFKNDLLQFDINAKF